MEMTKLIISNCLAATFGKKSAWLESIKNHYKKVKIFRLNSSLVILICQCRKTTQKLSTFVWFQIFVFEKNTAMLEIDSSRSESVNVYFHLSFMYHMIFHSSENLCHCHSKNPQPNLLLCIFRNPKALLNKTLLILVKKRALFLFLMSPWR